MPFCQLVFSSTTEKKTLFIL